MRSPDRKDVAAAFTIIVVTIFAYLPALRGEFVFDDELYITDNPLIKARDGLRRFWFSTEFSDYYALSNSMLWLEYRLWGADPTGYHVVNVLLHAVNSVLLWRLLRRLKIPGAWLAGLAFALHPVNVSTVAWISERKNMLSMLFLLVTALAYLRFDEAGSRRWYWGSVGLFLLALLSKTSVVMLPFALLGYAWWRRGRIDRTDLLRSIPFFVLSLALGLVTIWFELVKWQRATLDTGFFSRLAGAGMAIWFYLYKAIVPLNLSMIYPKWEIDPQSLWSYLPAVATLGVAGVFWRYRRTWGRSALFGLGYFVLMLFPVLGFFNQGFYAYSLVADHWQYAAIPGVIALVVAAASRAVEKWQPLRRVAVPAALVALGFLLAMSWQRATIFESEEALWRDTVKKNPAAWAAHNNLGQALVAEQKLDEAIRHYHEALRLNPRLPHVHYNLGLALMLQGRLEDARAHFERSLRMNPNFARAHYFYAKLLAEQGETARALPHFAAAIRLDPNPAEAYHDRARMLAADGRVEQAIADYAELLRIKPGEAEAHYELANLLAGQGRIGPALEQYRQAVRIAPDSAMAHANLGTMLVAQGLARDAEHHYREALRIDPQLMEAHYNLAVLLAQAGHTNEAISHLQDAVRLRPDLSEPKTKLAELSAQPIDAPDGP
jgi:tetratricopeptide (TPR) repeat protein